MDNYLWLLVVGLSLALMIGPVMMFKPSGRARHLASLRQHAASRGLRVRMGTYDHTGQARVMVAVYSTLMPSAQGQLSTQWCLRRQAMDHEIHFVASWDWDNSGEVAPQKQHSGLKKYLLQLDSSILAVEMSNHSLGLWWQEKNLSVDEIQQLLEQF